MQNNGRSNTWLNWRRWGRSRFSNEWNDGCSVPPTCFFGIITLSLQLNCGKGAALWFDASLLITMPAPWLGCFTPAALHYISVWHMDPVAWRPTCRRKGLEDLWKRGLHSYDGGVHDTTAQWTITCTVYYYSFAISHDPSIQPRLNRKGRDFSRAVDDTGHTFQRQF